MTANGGAGGRQPRRNESDGPGKSGIFASRPPQRRRCVVSFSQVAPRAFSRLGRSCADWPSSGLLPPSTAPSPLTWVLQAPASLAQAYGVADECVEKVSCLSLMLRPPHAIVLRLSAPRLTAPFFDHFAEEHLKVASLDPGRQGASRAVCLDANLCRQEAIVSPSSLHRLFCTFTRACTSRTTETLRRPRARRICPLARRSQHKLPAAGAARQRSESLAAGCWPFLPTYLEQRLTSVVCPAPHPPPDLCTLPNDFRESWRRHGPTTNLLAGIPKKH